VDKIDLSVLRWYSSQVYNKYPHLSKRETILWSKFMQVYQDKFLRLAYDVTVSIDLPGDRYKRKSIESNWEYLKSLKIDVLADRINEYRIIEIKPVFDLKAIGQLFVYKSLLPVIYNIDKSINLSVITESASGEIIRACKDLSISIYVEDTDFILE
jgi:hypothetical protein